MDRIFIWWIGEASEDAAMMEHVRDHLLHAFRCPVSTWASPERPRDAYDPKRKQHLSGKMLRFLLETGPDGGKVLGITDRDLFIPILTYVYGEAQLGGKAAVVSTARLWEDVDVIGPRLFAERLVKEAIHELGHAFGLVHCDAPRCVMRRSTNVAGLDLKSAAFCDDCRVRYRESLAFQEIAS